MVSIPSMLFHAALVHPVHTALVLGIALGASAGPFTRCVARRLRWAMQVWREGRRLDYLKSNKPIQESTK